MAIDEPEKLDAVGFRPADGQLELVIHDHLDWNSEDEHLEALTDKLNGYMVFLNSGQVAEIFPDADPASYESPWIRTVFAYSPTDTAIAFLQGLADQLRPHGLTIAYDLLDSEPRASFVL
jgi:hypothetical protein